MPEIEVFRLIKFDINKSYGYAYKTKTVGNFPNEKYYSTHTLEPLGKYTHSERWGGNWGDGIGGAENFIDSKGRKIRIEYDYNGDLCFAQI